MGQKLAADGGIKQKLTAAQKINLNVNFIISSVRVARVICFAQTGSS